MRNQPVVTWILLFVLGAAALAATMTLGMGLLGVILPVGGATLIAGLLEAAQARRTGRRHYVASWLPLLLGLLVPTAVMIAFDDRGPDSGVALSIVVFAFAIAIPTIAILVNVVALVALRASPGPRPAVPSPGPPPPGPPQ